MVVFPNAKINLGLHILSKREDGFHNIETAFFPVGWCDVLEINRSGKDDMRFTQTGIKAFGDNEQNLCVKAYRLMTSHHKIGPVNMHLHKIIPIGAGLGGGSSDAAFTLLLLNKIFQLNIPEHILESYASALGSDCAFFVRNNPQLATQRGNQFKSLTLHLNGYYLVIVKPKKSVRTVDAYQQVVPAKPAQSLQALLKLPVDQWKGNLVNDFEKTIFKKHPSIAGIKDKLYNLGAIYASMSGSGSAVFGLFEKHVDASQHFRGSTVWQSLI